MGRAFGLTSQAMACGLTARQLAGHTLANAVSGGLTGAATDAAMQAMDPDLKGFSWSRVLAAGVNGTIGGGVGYFQNRAITKSCFAAGTPLLVRGPGGELSSKRIEDVIAGDAVLSRDESDAGGDAAWRGVEEVFRRFAGTVELRLEGGVRIGTTGEHPFFVADRLAAIGGGGTMGNEWVSNRNGGATAVAEVERVACGEWLPAWELRAGDSLVGHDGRRVGVEGVRETGLWEPVYNLRVADYHTYFVGCDGWGFSVWAHNVYDTEAKRESLRMRLNRAEVAEDARTVIQEIGAHKNVPGAMGDAWADHWTPARLRELNALPHEERATQVRSAAEKQGLLELIDRQPTVESYDRGVHYGYPSHSPEMVRSKTQYAGRPCAECGTTMTPGTPHAPSPDHSPPLGVHFWEGAPAAGSPPGRTMTQAQREAWARSADSVRGCVCQSCNFSAGSRISRQVQALERQFYASQE